MHQNSVLTSIDEGLDVYGNDMSDMGQIPTVGFVAIGLMDVPELLGNVSLISTLPRSSMNLTLSPPSWVTHNRQDAVAWAVFADSTKAI